jgi:CRISPR-associated protein Cmr4
MTKGAARSFEMLGMVAETFVLPGVGEARSAIDLPVSRESTTGYPYAAASTVKGSLREAYRRHDGGGPDPSPQESKIFGSPGGADQEGAGGAIFADVRLLLLPVRSLLDAVRYVTCPALIFRFIADRKRAGMSDENLNSLRTVAAKLVDHFDAQARHGLALVPTAAGGILFLEEYAFEMKAATQLNALAAEFSKLVPETAPNQLFLKDRLTVITDESFAWYAENALPVRMRNRLEEGGSKRVQGGALWSEEYIAPETVMYTLVGNRSTTEDRLPDIKELLSAEGNYVRVGANETIGHGWFGVSWYQVATDTKNGGENNGAPS